MELKPYNSTQSKSIQVEKMFDNIAHAYDRLNHTLSLGIDKSWRRKAIAWLKPYHPEKILDIATGTGDFAIQAFQGLHPETLIGTDISEGMMDIGRQKVKNHGLDGKIQFKREDCQNLSFPDASFDALTVAFGIRNFENLHQCLTEMNRVLKNDGKLVILELTKPENFPMKQLYTIYSKVVIPVIGKLLSKDKSAYKYLPESIKAFPQGEKMKNILLKAGFENATYKRMTFGICTLYTANKAIIKKSSQLNTNT